MVYSLVSGMIAPPLLGALLLALFEHRTYTPAVILASSTSRRKDRGRFMSTFPSHLARWITLLSTGTATLCALILLRTNTSALHNTGDLFTFTWLPDTGHIGLHLGDTGLTMALVTSGSLFLTQILFMPETQRTQNRLPSSAPLPPCSPASVLPSLLALSAANIAFLSNNFLGRYVALEVAGLCIALAPLLELPRGMSVARYVYLTLRVGDAGFLAGILLLMRATGTLNITAALETGTTLLPSQLMWLVAGFVLAVWIKVGAWPLHGWILAGLEQSAPSLSLPSSTWLYGIVMPNLGLYLLYRVTPLLIASGTLWKVLFWLSVIAMGITVLLAFLRRRDGEYLPVIGGAFLGGLALCFATLGMKAQVWWVAVAFAPLRILVTGVTGKFSMDVTDLNRKNPLISGELFQFVKSVDYLSRIAQFVRRIVEVGVLERLVTDVPQALLTIARWLYRVVEQGALEGALRGTARAALATGHWIRRRHTGQLRLNLAWGVITLIIAIVFILSVP
ncbi:MAG: hypothetical protein JXA33_24335 [Anaerolineae bacterium]|nr:hypothetical protein [Anaerolineae bacterium]